MSNEIKRYPVAIRGICDDAYCPECNYEFRDDETDANICPMCGTYMDWSRYHVINDKEEEI